MDANEVVEFLTWLEGTFPVRLEFRDKRDLAESYVDQRSWKIWKEYTENKRREVAGK